MRKTLIVSVLTVMAAWMLFSCGDDNPVESNGPSPEFVGTWSGTVPAIPTMLPQAVNIQVKIDDTPDSSYSLLVWYDSTGDTALKNLGAWTVVDTTILLAGTECGIIDTSTDQLRTIDSTTCAGPIEIPIDITTDQLTSTVTWSIKVSDLASVGEALKLPMDNSIIAQLSLVLTKQ